jgi:hypothetical protein
MEEKQNSGSNAAGPDSATKKTVADAGSPPLPEINFASFIISLSSSALFHFGEIPDPATNQRERNLPLAKQTIDILGLLKEKTSGNLDREEHQLLDSLLYDLRMRYVEQLKKDAG